MLFITFIIFIPIAVWLILYLTSRQKQGQETDAPKEPIEVCAVCQEEFPMNQLLEKEIGGYGRVYCFCGQCIENLYHESQNKNKTDTETGE